MSGYSNLARKRVVAKAKEVTHIEFFDGKPNYFRVTNNGTGKLYFSCSRVPTLINYDFACEGDSVKLWAEPYERGFIDIFNPTTEDIAVDLLTFYADFDPLALAFSGMSFDFSATSIETTTSIDSFKTSLPSGSNKIGKVDVANLKDYATALSDIHSKLDILDLRSRKFTHFKTDTATVSGVTYNTGATICEIAFLSNDGSTDLTLSITETDGTVNSIVVKSGEVLNHINCTLSSIKLVGNSVPFRLAYCERNGG